MPEPLNDKTRVAEAFLTDGSDDIIQHSLEFVRTHFGMEISYLSEFVGDELVFRAVSAPGLEEVVHEGYAMPVAAVYCPYILSGELPELMPDTTKIPLTKGIPITDAVPIRSHISVPIKRADGSVYGMFCCLSRQANPSLNERDLGVMRAFAALSANALNETLGRQANLKDRQDRIERALGGAFEIYYQPIFDTNTQVPTGVEALSRFESDPYVPPNVWFDEAAEIGRLVDLELLTARRALEALPSFPNECYLSVNVSPQTVLSGRIIDLLSGLPTERIVIELTEHMEVESYDEIVAAVDGLRMTGVRLAIDDAGAGYSGLQHMVRLKPDIIKLDQSLTARIDVDIARRSLCGAMVRFGRDTGARLVAEGVEKETELIALSDLGVEMAQGFWLARPGPLETVLGVFGDQNGRRPISSSGEV